MLLTGKSWRMPASGNVTDATSIIDVLLKNRNIEDAGTFLSEDGGVWHDPFLYKDMQKAVDLINEVMNRNGKILVYGDYDCDGVTATAILVRYFRAHHADVGYLVPQRAEHGYGLSEKIMDKVISENPDLVITVDCSSTAASASSSRITITLKTRSLLRTALSAPREKTTLIRSTTSAAQASRLRS